MRQNKYWIFVYLFAKKDKENISAKELKDFRKLAELNTKKNSEEIKREIGIGELMEICK